MTPRTKTRRIIWHHSAGPRSQPASDIIAFHTRPKSQGGRWETPLAQVAYHYLIEEGGTIRVGRDIHFQGAHDAGENADSIGVCIIGDNTRPGHEWTPIQITSARDLRRSLEMVYGQLLSEGHRDQGGDATECPGVKIAGLL